MSHAAAAAGEYRRMMEEKNRAGFPTQAVVVEVENAEQAGTEGTDTATPKGTGTTPKIMADDGYDHFKDCEEEEEEEVGAPTPHFLVQRATLFETMALDSLQGAWHAPATAEEEKEEKKELEAELSPLEKEPTAGMLFVHVVELYLQDAPDHMPVWIPHYVS